MRSSSVSAGDAKSDGIVRCEGDVEELLDQIDVAEMESLLPGLELGANETRLAEVFEAARDRSVASEKKATPFAEMKNRGLQVD